MEERIFELADNLSELNDRKKELEQELKDLKQNISETNESLAQEMVNEELQNFTRNGLMFYLQTQTYVSDVASEREVLFEKLRDQGFGDLIKETVHPSTLRGFVKEQIEQEGGDLPGWLDGLISIYEQEQVRMRKS